MKRPKKAAKETAGAAHVLAISLWGRSNIGAKNRRAQRLLFVPRQYTTTLNAFLNIFFLFLAKKDMTAFCRVLSGLATCDVLRGVSAKRSDEWPKIDPFARDHEPFVPKDVDFAMSEPVLTRTINPDAASVSPLIRPREPKDIELLEEQFRLLISIECTLMNIIY
jgi:hypothetical protein